MNQPLVIGVVLTIRNIYGRGALTGISRYALHAGWRVVFQSSDEFEPADVETWNNRGINGFLMQMTGPATVELAGWGLPTVNVSTVLPAQTGIPTVSIDNRRVGHAAAEHLLLQSLPHFAYLDDPTRYYSQTRKEGYIEALARAGHTCSTLVSTKPREMAAWVEALPKPVGILASNDTQAAELLHACLAASVEIRGRVALVGVDNAYETCEATFPRLSSVAVPAERIGWEAAVMLDGMIGAAARGKSILPADVWIPPDAVVVRESSVLQVVDAEVAQAMRLIRTRFQSIGGVDELADSLAISRRTLERRFLKILGRSPLEEILRARLATARQLLVETELPVSQIARQSGFESATRLGVVFRQSLGCTPSQYRHSAKTGRTK